MTANWTAELASKLICGPGALQTLNHRIKVDKILICSSKSIMQLTEVKEFLTKLHAREVNYLENILPNPSPESIDSAFRLIKGDTPELVIAVGGGSVIDFAKVLVALLSNSPVSNTLDLVNLGKYEPRICGFIAIPTTCGTGSEVTPFATIWAEDGSGKLSIDSLTVTPDLAILHGGLSASCSPDQMLFSGLDAVSHCVETLWNQNRTVLSEMFAREGLESLVRVLPKVIRAGGSVDELQTLQEAAMLAGLAISQSRTAIAHSISYPITSSYGMPHGLACSFTIPAIWAEIDQAKKLDLKHASLIQKAVELIESFDLSTKVSRWLNLRDSTALLGAMLNSNRAGNFIQNTDERMLKNILNSSF